MKKLLFKILKFYKKKVSPGVPATCIFKPTCSEYAMQALKKHSLMKAIILIIYRLLRCNPLNKGGFDPVPDNKKVIKWLI